MPQCNVWQHLYNIYEKDIEKGDLNLKLKSEKKTNKGSKPQNTTAFEYTISLSCVL